MLVPVDPPKTRRDLESLPDNIRAEIIDGVLYTLPKARFRHQHAIGAMAFSLGPFGQHGGTPGGWVIAPEPGIELPRAAEIIPDLAGWRRERWVDPSGSDPIRLVPDWVCEVLSPGTRRHDLILKAPFYAQVGVDWLWLVDLDARAVFIRNRVGNLFVDHSVFEENDAGVMEPFDSLQLSISNWWAP